MWRFIVASVHCYDNSLWRLLGCLWLVWTVISTEISVGVFFLLHRSPHPFLSSLATHSECIIALWSWNSNRPESTSLRLNFNTHSNHQNENIDVLFEITVAIPFSSTLEHDIELNKGHAMYKTDSGFWVMESRFTKMIPLCIDVTVFPSGSLNWTDVISSDFWNNLACATACSDAPLSTIIIFM